MNYVSYLSIQFLDTPIVGQYSDVTREFRDHMNIE